MNTSSIPPRAFALESLCARKPVAGGTLGLFRLFPNEYKKSIVPGHVAQPFQGKKKGADTGIDDVKFFRDLNRWETRRIVVSVNDGGIKPDGVRALNHVREREATEIALFISLESDARDGEGCRLCRVLRKPHGKKFGRVQLIRIDSKLDGMQRAEHPDYEADWNSKKAKAEADAEQQNLI